MSIDYSVLKFSKGTPKVSATRSRKADEEKQDREQRALCRTRSGGRCEAKRKGSRCRRKATENHHIKGGHGRRNKGESLLAAWRVDLCLICHHDHHANLLDITGPAPFTFEERDP